MFWFQMIVAVSLTALVTVGLLKEPLLVEWEYKQMAKIKKAFTKR